MTKKLYQVRQGDVFLFQIAEALPDAEKCKPVGDNHVLAYGEATGHCHAINKNECELYHVNDNILKIAKSYGVKDERAVTHGLRIVAKNARLRHGTPSALFRDPDHTDIKMPAGDYIVMRPRQYSGDEEFRVVAD